MNTKNTKNAKRKIFNDKEVARIVAKISKFHKFSGRKLADNDKRTTKKPIFEQSLTSEMHVTKQKISFVFYTIKFFVWYDEQSVMQKNQTSKILDFKNFNVIATERIDDKINDRDTITYFKFVVIIFAIFKNFCQQLINESNDWNIVDELVKTWIENKRKNVIIILNYKYDSKSIGEVFFFFQKRQRFANFNNDDEFISCDDFSSFFTDEPILKKKAKKNKSKKKRKIQFTIVKMKEKIKKKKIRQENEQKRSWFNAHLILRHQKLWQRNSLLLKIIWLTRKTLYITQWVHFWLKQKHRESKRHDKWVFKCVEKSNV